MTSKALGDFIEAWGSMGMLWGINRSMARIHALLIASDEPLTLDAIAERLQISRGNTSMSLRELRNWGVVRRVNLPGDRHDHWVTEPDVWMMFFRIAAERKKRELDPARDAVKQALARLDDRAARAVKGRLEQMSDLLATLDSIATRFLADPASSQAMLAFVAGSIGAPPRRER